METIRLKFIDFWQGFDPVNNYFYKLLSGHYNIELSDTPDILIYSSYTNQHFRYKCTKVFYTGENVRPDFRACDFAITFDFNDHPGHYRLPLYAMYIDNPAAMATMQETITRQEATERWKSKTKFCCMVVSNPAAQKRINFYKKLSAYKQVDSGGTVLNNVGGPVEDKLAFIKDYKFAISFENAAYEGYTTEKIAETLLGGCIPLYWGNPLIEKDFNPGCFLNLTSQKTEEDFINEIIEIDKDDEKAVDILMQPKFNNNKIPAWLDKEKLLLFFREIIEASKKDKPVAQTFTGLVHKCRIKKEQNWRRIKNAAKKYLSIKH